VSSPKYSHDLSDHHGSSPDSAEMLRFFGQHHKR
jgi:hypothetical protein